MRYTVLAFFAVLLFSAGAFCQSAGSNCKCPANPYAGEKADTVYQLGGGHAIALCGYANYKDTPATYSEFVLSACGRDSIIAFWGATLTCRLKTVKDTLLVEQLYNLPVGPHFANVRVPFVLDKIFFDGWKPHKVTGVNKHIPLYTKAQISKVLKEFERIKDGRSCEHTDLMSKLFVAAVSGNVVAESYFKDFRMKFPDLNGVNKEDYNCMRAMLELWKK